MAAGRAQRAGAGAKMAGLLDKEVGLLTSEFVEILKLDLFELAFPGGR